MKRIKELILVTAAQEKEARGLRKPLQHHMCGGSKPCDCVADRLNGAPKGMTRAQFLSREVR